MSAHGLIPLVLLCAALGLPCGAEAPAKIELWPDGAPGARGGSDDDQPFLEYWPAPQSHATGAAFVICPGGGYGMLSTDGEGRQVARLFNGMGVSGFVLHYRLGTKGYHYPIQLIDVQRAVRHVRANAARYGIDPRRIGIMGFSAGGHLASMAATLFGERPEGSTHDAVDRVSARPDVAVLCYPVISMAEKWTHVGSRDNLLGPRAGDAALARAVSTDLRVTDRTPPTFLFQTDEDISVPAENAVQFYLACRRHGVPAELHVYRAGPHGLGLALNDPVVGGWSGHLRYWLRNQGFFAPVPRAAIQGTLTVNGRPVSWGDLVFESDNPDAPLASAHVARGKFSLKAADGPVVGPVRVTATYSTADVPGLETPEGVETTRFAKAGDREPWTVVIAPGSDTLALEIRR